jgi:hypothetical protein
MREHGLRVTGGVECGAEDVEGHGPSLAECPTASRSGRSQ